MSAVTNSAASGRGASQVVRRSRHPTAQPDSEGSKLVPVGYEAATGRSAGPSRASSPVADTQAEPTAETVVEAVVVALPVAAQAAPEIVAEAPVGEVPPAPTDNVAPVAGDAALDQEMARIAAGEAEEAPAEAPVKPKRKENPDRPANSLRMPQEVWDKLDEARKRRNPYSPMSRNAAIIEAVLLWSAWSESDNPCAVCPESLRRAHHGPTAFGPRGGETD